jgi:hypothetical protein
MLEGVVEQNETTVGPFVLFPIHHKRAEVSGRDIDAQVVAQDC